MLVSLRFLYYAGRRLRQTVKIDLLPLALAVCTLKWKYMHLLWIGDLLPVSAGLIYGLDKRKQNQSQTFAVNRKRGYHFLYRCGKISWTNTMLVLITSVHVLKSSMSQNWPIENLPSLSSLFDVTMRVNKAIQILGRKSLYSFSKTHEYSTLHFHEHAGNIKVVV